jgi:hypothetical protein
MKYVQLIILILLFTNCKNDSHQNSTNTIEEIQQIELPTKDTIQIIDADIKSLNKSISIELKQKALIEKKDESKDLQKLIIDKRYVVDNKDYTINFNYPILNESFKITNRNFNEFISEYYINVTQTEADILESKLLCDSIALKKFREERYIDYKIYNVNDQLLSILFYKENFYSGAMHPSFSFDCFNFDLDRGVFMIYEDFFIQGSEEELLAIINENIIHEMQKGSLYYDCWEIALPDFFESKNNFVLNETYLEFYFDDCVMCPSYTGSYSLKLNLVDLLSVLKKHDLNPLAF